MREISIAIVGAGFSGLGMAIQLQKRGIHSFTIFEAADEVGGTWRDNHYPGCACDVPSHLYSFSFEPKPDWTRKYGEQHEIFEYLKDVTDRHGLREHIRFETPVVAARYDEDEARWHLTTGDGETATADVLVTGTGPLSVPTIPAVEGLARFTGPTFHSARWDHDVDLAGKRVAVVGTGASAIQLVPRIAPEVARLHLFQRTPPWVLPKPDRAFHPLEKRLFAAAPPLHRAYRYLTYWAREWSAFGFVAAPGVLDYASRFARRHVEAQVDDPALRDLVTPDYRMGCKRVLISNDYYPALNRENVEVVPHGLSHVTERAVIASDGSEREVDAIVFATGFDVRAFLNGIEVRGRGGRTLDEAWADGAEAYYGLLVSGFPNLYTLLGPNTGLGHNSMVFMIEAQVRYVLQCLERMRREDLASLEVRADDQRAFDDSVQERLGHTVWSTGCQSWYLDENGRNFTLWPGFTFEYWLRTRRPDRRHFRAEPRRRSRAVAQSSRAVADGDRVGGAPRRV
ncbi:MAG TPA: NAD(P)/FAD-dependent oxidoreductase [Sandaracinaceae bacterium LLY-WYZ-13_1]|nr:NAD(P)/FAD-dependent oxidoreductase [Sandaracinaceae bacterium LLY-WYZ-13_1]